MKNSAKRTWQWLDSIRRRSIVEFDTARQKKTRARWFGRLFSICIDLGAYAMIFFILASPLGITDYAISSSLLLGSFPVYYMVAESILGRSIGKFFMGYKMAVSPLSSARGYLVWRGILRLIPGINILLILSWRRVTLLDLLSGTRVRLSHLDESPRQTKKSSPSSATPQHHPESGPHPRRKIRGRPRGFNPDLLKR
jgi:hypothetical protein